MAFCQECGNKLEEGAKFCGECGAPVPTRASNPRPTSGTAEDAFTDVVQAPTAPGEFVVGTWTAEPDTAPMGAASPAAGAFVQNSGTTPSAPKKSKLPLVIGGVAVLAVIVLVALYVVPLFIPHPHDPHEDVAYVPPTEEAQTKPEVVAKPEDESTQDTVEPVQEVEVEPNPEPEPEPEPQPEPLQQPTSYATSDTPVIGEFTWFSNDMMNGNAPADVARITDVDAVTGGWKAYIYNYAIADNEYSQPSEELLNVYIDAGQGGTTLTFDWYYTRGGDGQAYENTQPNTEYAGAWANGVLEAYGMGSVRLTDFWERDGHQYAIGRIGWPDGVDASIALVRP